MRKLIDGIMAGTGFVMVLAVAFAIAWAGDVLTVDKDGTPKFAVSDAGKITVGATESYVNLVIQNNAAAANNKVDIAADVLTVEGIRLESVSVSADITASGAGGLDTGSEAGDTWYYVWVIVNNTGASTNGLLSISSTSPTLPAGYTKKRRVGSVRNDGSSNLYQFVQEGNFVGYDDVISTMRALSAGTATSYTDVSLASFVAPTSRRAVIRLISAVNLGTTVGTSFFARVRKNGSSSALGHMDCQLYCTSTTAVFDANGVVGSIDTDNSRVIEYKIDSAPGSGGVNIDVKGYYDRI